MKLKNIEEVEAFRNAVRACTGDVYLKSVDGDVYIALGRLLSEQGDSLELFASNREDEAQLLGFVEDLYEEQEKNK